MTENGNQTRPVRTLTVKNFSVIKEAKLEFGKITVLIGPQASGKSLLCKLAYFLGREVIGIATGWAQNGLTFLDFEDAVKRHFERWFPKTGWGKNDWSIYFASEGYSVSISNSASASADPVLALGPGFKELYESDCGPPNDERTTTDRTILLRGLGGKSPWDAFAYIPAERTYFVDVNKGYKSLASDPDPIVQAFATFYEDSRVAEIQKPRTRLYLKGDVIRGKEEWIFAFEDGRVLPLNELSSGAKEILPLLAVLEAYEQLRPTFLSKSYSGSLKFDDFFIEEPESHIFPDMQQELVRYFVELANAERLRPRFTITTHSPYILSAFNNLIEAGQAARNNPKLRDEIAKIVPERYWVKEGDFRAYSIHDGKLESILSESGFIDGNYLDQVSEVIGNEFDELLRLEYENSEAS